MSNTHADEISLAQIWAEIYRKKIAIIGSSFLFGIFAIFIALKLPNMYTAKVLLVPTSEEEGGLAALAKNFGGLASIAGIGLGQSSGPDKGAIAQEVLKSQQFINDFVNNHNIVVPLIASKASKAITYELVIDEDLYDTQAKKWVREVEPPKTVEPTPEEIFEAFLDILEIEQDPKTGFVNLSVEFYSPSMAKEWLDLLVVDINEKMKKDDQMEAQKSIDYLTQLINETRNSKMQQTFYQLLEEQTKTLMLTESRTEYIFKTIASASVPEKKSKPKRVLIVIAGILIGGLLAFMVVLIRFFSRNK